ncbi:MAG: SDR family oxidoreductase [Flavobacteriales bacterium]|jgi:short-subunit dehydrogenase/FAD/FMN-containing dehydrogenase|nr:SDR family oxidoreductase [Flavobacteriales bacterium]MBK7248926.1 SDR family oxidoreductase [Flavobacteriales bacterium]MBK9058834.1 SDR family oxidoreductase [Flavobacteriales bacterium]MBK9600042.1 SDR family oxidoreductase [Flavobacteriales bacterium]QQS71179.1 MAG: SDR family oxidoreductase [Flavobacteriales bacterium]
MHIENGRFSNWGNYPVRTSTSYAVESAEEVQALLREGGQWTPRGNGRSYGDASLGARMLDGRSLPPVFELDADRGTVNCGAGMLLDELLLRIVPEGFFLPVSPGTRLITVGGAIAADIHGKNHHCDGSFSAHVLEMHIVTGDGEMVICSSERNGELYWATIGGMGLTGMIVSATIALKRITSAYIRQRSIKCKNLSDLFAAFEEHADATYSVAWIDLLARGKKLGRGVLLLGEHEPVERLPAKLRRDPLKVHSKAKVGVPFFFPAFALSNLTVRVFNELFYGKHGSGARESMVHYGPYFHPLDAVGQWNRIYGRRGFLQYQVVVPLKGGEAHMRTIIEELSNARVASFLAVLKRFGPGNDRSPMSFPMEGYTLALDIPRSARVFAVLDRIDAMVAEAGGRIYLAKDARMSGSTLRATYAGLSGFQRTVAKEGQGHFTSSLAERMALQSNQMETPHFDPKAVLILGATSDIAAAMADRFAREGRMLILAGRDMDRLRGMAEELGRKHGAVCVPLAFDATRTEGHRAFYEGLDPRPGSVVCAFGELPDQIKAQEDPALALRSIMVNYAGAVSILELAAADLEGRGTGHVVGISSVAGDRGRASNYIYGSAKAGFTTYLSGLRHRLFKSGVQVLTVKPGFVRTRMTEGLPLPAPLTATADQAAAAIIKAMRRKRNTVYVLGRWRCVMAVVRNLPEFIFKRTKL